MFNYGNTFRHLQYSIQGNYYILQLHAINIGKHENNYIHTFSNTMTNLCAIKAIDRY